MTYDGRPLSSVSVGRQHKGVPAPLVRSLALNAGDIRMIAQSSVDNADDRTIGIIYNSLLNDNGFEVTMTIQAVGRCNSWCYRCWCLNLVPRRGIIKGVNCFHRKRC